MPDRNITRGERGAVLRIRELREFRGWSQAELADRMTKAGHPMHQTVISKIERSSPTTGRRSIALDEAIGLASVLGVTLETLANTGHDRATTAAVAMNRLLVLSASVAVTTRHLTGLRALRKELTAAEETAGRDLTKTMALLVGNFGVLEQTVGDDAGHADLLKDAYRVVENATQALSVLDLTAPDASSVAL